MRVNVTAQGIVGRDPELTFSKNGKPWVKFPIAVTERIKENNEWKDGNTTWFDVIAWNTTAEAVAEYVSKGNRVVVVGSLKRQDWEARDGTPKVTLEIAAETVGLAPFAPKGGQPRAVSKQQTEAPF